MERMFEDGYRMCVWLGKYWSKYQRMKIKRKNREGRRNSIKFKKDSWGRNLWKSCILLPCENEIHFSADSSLSNVIIIWTCLNWNTLYNVLSVFDHSFKIVSHVSFSPSVLHNLFTERYVKQVFVQIYWTDHSLSLTWIDLSMYFKRFDDA